MEVNCEIKNGVKKKGIKHINTRQVEEEYLDVTVIIGNMGGSTIPSSSTSTKLDALSLSCKR